MVSHLNTVPRITFLVHCCYFYYCRCGMLWSSISCGGRANQHAACHDVVQQCSSEVERASVACFIHILRTLWLAGYVAHIPYIATTLVPSSQSLPQQPSVYGLAEIEKEEDLLPTSGIGLAVRRGVSRYSSMNTYWLASQLDH